MTWVGNKLKYSLAHFKDWTGYESWKTSFFYGTLDYLATSGVIVFIIITLKTGQPVWQGLGISALLFTLVAFVRELKRKEATSKK